MVTKPSKPHRISDRTRQAVMDGRKQHGWVWRATHSVELDLSLSARANAIADIIMEKATASFAEKKLSFEIWTERRALAEKLRTTTNTELDLSIAMGRFGISETDVTSAIKNGLRKG